jgi:hypothetical protein
LDIFGHREFEELTCVYLSNIQYINYYMSYNHLNPQKYSEKVMKILKDFKNLKSLLIYTEAKLSGIITYSDMKEIEKNYQVKSYNQYLLFLKHEYINDRT